MKVAQKGPFVMLLTKAAQDERLSYRALGVLSYMASLPEDWDFSINRMAKRRPESEHLVRKAVRELLNAGYVHREPCRQGNRFNGWSYKIMALSEGTRE